ncbi:MAG: hypothetical protein IT310_14295 [Anaerolineales bacterium]|nr:hypothetical protein [Anaerolineales bacterium]
MLKKVDIFLIGIVLGIVALVVVAFTIALVKPKPAHQSEDTPEGVSYNFLLALQQKDYERAYEYLSPDILGYPARAEDLADNTNGAFWGFNDLRSGSSSFEIVYANEDGALANVKVQINKFYENGLFDSGQYTSTLLITLRRDHENQWKIIKFVFY